MRDEEIMAAATRRGLLMFAALLLAMTGAGLALPPALQAFVSFAGSILYGL